ncbi:MAG: glycosyltransferase family 39 protein, partial [Dehalococcoidia bacterium]|nr:glycosyltransferase family 39 protein [Dehalococcoidia bacterium]
CMIIRWIRGNKKVVAALAGITVFSFVIRLIGIRFALPTISYDEGSIMERVWDMAAAGDLNPHWFRWPSFHFYIDLAILKTMQLFVPVTRENFALACRVFEAVIGALTVPVAYFIGRSLYDKPAGLISAFLLAIFPAHVFYSHIGKPDILPIFFELLALLASIYILKTVKLKYYIMAGVFVGLAVSAKYNAAFCVAAPFAAHFIYLNTYQDKHVDIEFRSLFICVGLMAAAFFVSMPFALLDIRTFLNDVIYQAGRMEPGATEGTLQLVVRLWGDFVHWCERLTTDWGIGLSILSVAGLGYSIKRHNRYDVLNIIYIVVCMITLLFWSPTSKFIIPIGIVLLIMSSGFIVALLGRIKLIKRRVRRQLASLLLALALIVVIFNPVVSVIQQDSNLQKTSISNVAMDWAIENISSGSRVFCGVNTSSLKYLVMDDGMPRFDVFDRTEPTWEYDGYQRFAEDNYEYVILTDPHLKFAKYPHRWPREADFYGNFFMEYELVKELRGGGKYEYGASTIEFSKSGNRMYIYRKK